VGARRDQLAIVGSLAAITAAAWLYTVGQADRMSMQGAMSGASMGSTMHAMLATTPWTGGEFTLLLSMWVVMMIAMMAPTATPMTLVYAAIARKAAAQRNPIAPTFVFVAGYLTAWSLFAVLATLTQRGLDQAALLSPAMVSNSSVLGGGLLIAAGIYEVTPLKHACLRHCRAPAHFLSSHWRPGAVGAFRLGLRLGVYCLGCCWILMALLFVAGVMNLLWIAAIAALVLIEKALPKGDRAAVLVAAASIVAGVTVLAV
jgi:predicted metal-binding membrane protein